MHKFSKILYKKSDEKHGVGSHYALGNKKEHVVLVNTTHTY